MLPGQHDAFTSYICIIELFPCTCIMLTAFFFFCPDPNTFSAVVVNNFIFKNILNFCAPYLIIYIYIYVCAEDARAHTKVQSGTGGALALRARGPVILMRRHSLVTMRISHDVIAGIGKKTGQEQYNIYNIICDEKLNIKKNKNPTVHPKPVLIIYYYYYSSGMEITA